MESDTPDIVDQIARDAADGSLLPPCCVNCGGSPAESHELWAICQRGHLRWEDSGNRDTLFGFIGGIPFFILLSTDAVEIREGIDIVCPVPLRVCDQCWQEVEGGTIFRWLSNLSQFFFIAAVVMFLVWMVSKNRAWDVPYLWAAGSLAAALPFRIAASVIEAQQPRRLRDLVGKVDRYHQLLEVFPNADLRTTEPRVLTGNAGD